MQVSLPCQISLPELTNTYYPFNSSLEDEMKRLFVNCTIDTTKKPEPPKLEDIMEDFRQNGRDYEYCPDVGKDPVVESSSSSSSSSSMIRRKKINRRPVPTECVFCRNNGEEESYYKGHVAKDTQGRVLCPVLRAYTCPICGANGDHAHTLKYCPKGPKKTEMAAPNAFKQTRNAVGKRRHPTNTRASHKT